MIKAPPTLTKPGGGDGTKDAPPRGYCSKEYLPVVGTGGEIYSSLEGGRNGRYTPTQTGQGPPGPDGAYRDQGRSRAPRPFPPPARRKAGTRGAGAVWAGARASRPFSPHSRPRQDPGGPGRSRRTHGHRARFPRTRTQGRNPGGQGGVGGRHKAKYERALARTKDAQDVSPAGAT